MKTEKQIKKEELLKCIKCGKRFVEVTPNAWRPDCEHLNKDLNILVL